MLGCKRTNLLLYTVVNFLYICVAKSSSNRSSLMMQLLIMLPNNDGIMVTFLVCFWFTLARRRSPDYERRAVAGEAASTQDQKHPNLNGDEKLKKAGKIALVGVTTGKLLFF